MARAIAALIAIMQDEDAPVHRRIEATAGLPEYAAPVPAVEAAKEFLTKIFEDSEICGRTGEGRKRAQAAGVKFGRKPKLSAFQREETLKRHAAGEMLASIAKSYAVDLSMISRLE